MDEHLKRTVEADHEERFQAMYGISMEEVKRVLKAGEKQFPHYFDDFPEVVKKIEEERRNGNREDEGSNANGFYMKRMGEQNPEAYASLLPEDLSVWNQIFFSFSSWYEIIKDQIISAEDKEKFANSIKSFSDMYEILLSPFCLYAGIREWNGFAIEKGLNSWQKTEYKKKYHEEEHIQTQAALDDPELARAENEFLDYRKDFCSAESDAFQIICEECSKEKKAEVLDRYVEKLQMAIDGNYLLECDKDDAKDHAEECEEQKIIDLNEDFHILIDFYNQYYNLSSFTEKELLEYKDPISYDTLLILYNKYRIDEKHSSRDFFFSSVQHLVRQNLADGKEKESVPGRDKNLYHSYADAEKAGIPMASIMGTYNCILNAERKIHEMNAEVKKSRLAGTGPKGTDEDLKGEIGEGKRQIRTELDEIQKYAQEYDATRNLELELKRAKQLDDGSEESRQKISTINKQIQAELTYCDADTLYETIRNTMDIICIFQKGLELYQRLEGHSTESGKELAKIIYQLKRIDGELKDKVFQEPYLYEEHAGSIREADEHFLSSTEYQAKDLEVMEKDIALEETKERESENQKQLKKLKEERKRDKNRIRCLIKMTQDTIAQLKGKSYEEIMEQKQAIIRNVKVDLPELFTEDTDEDDTTEDDTNEDIMTKDITKYLDQLVEEINDILRHQVQTGSNKEEFEKAQKLVEQELEGKHGEELSKDIKNILATAEFLYSKYIDEKDESTEIDGFDYSCVSAMFYQALEKTYQYVLFVDYADEVSGVLTDRYEELKFDDEFHELGNSKKNAKISKMLKENGYLYDPAKYLCKKEKIYNEMSKRCEYVKMSTILYWAIGKEWNDSEQEYTNTENTEDIVESMRKYEKYLRVKFGWKKDDYSLCHLSSKVYAKLEDIAYGLKEASKRRNNACHGGTKVSRKEAIEDKQWVLPKSEAAKESQNCKKLILEILSLYDLE